MLEKIWKAILRRGSLSLLMLPAFLLWIVSLFYRAGFALKRRMAGNPLKLSVPVVSVGNITVGGSGKTPMVEFLARHLVDAGIRVAIVSSGYGRTNEISFVEEGYKVQERSTDDTGDEVMLLANSVPEAHFSVDRSKTEAARRVAESGLVDVIIVDDGFQHFKLARDLDILAFDAAVRPQMLRPFPYGMLREPVSALSRADVIIITRSNFAKDRTAIRKMIQKHNPNAPLYHAHFSVTELIGSDKRYPVKYLEDKSVFLFAGIGNFRSLRKQVNSLAGDLDFALELSDHQQYDQAMLEKIKKLADEHESDLVLTTGKDWVKLGDFDFGRESYYLGLSIDLDPGEERLVSYLTDKLGLQPREN
ncbi:MAG: tetraacyldisaccharide 4'-kinase [bacterium]|nr:tetraacyldisaccharide 4'-kinase [bacterium]